jgi:type 1 glutamine amidotransferase
MLTATAGFHHDSIPTALQVVSELSSRTGAFTVQATGDVRFVTRAMLASTDVLLFALTTGELPFDDGQKEAIVAFVNNGGGFVGIHSASDTLYSWPDYGRIVGAYFKEHPWIQEATVTVEDRSHPVVAGLAGTLRLVDEFYTFRQNPRPSVHVLLSLDASSVGAEGDFPLSWTQTIGRGRSYYNALGHFDGTWRDASFQSQLLNGLRWAAGR